MRRALLTLALVVVLAGCTVPQFGGGDDPDLEGGIGTVGDISYDQDIPLDTADGLNETELEVLTARTMARIEVIRGLNFERMVDIEVITRDEYLDRRSNQGTNATSSQWENQLWEGLFVVGEDRNATTVYDETLGGSVQGYYQPGDEKIVIVSEGDSSTVDRETLVHELVHALQDQVFGLETDRTTQDGVMARNSVIEGEASLIPALYFDRCGSEWSCPTLPSEERGGDSIERERGIIFVVIQPYEQGPTFVREMKSAGGWDRIDDLHETLPDSTEQVIHPDKYPDEDPVNVTVPDRSTDDWSRFGIGRTGDRLGEASVYAMLLHSGAITTSQPYSYEAEASAGWAGDRFVPYRTGDGEFGYVWQLEFDTSDDAAEFETAYLELLDERGALERGTRSFVIPDGPFEDAFRVTRDGKTVTIVNGPSVDALSDIHEK